jgi:hypothetical protein
MGLVNSKIDFVVVVVLESINLKLPPSRFKIQLVFMVNFCLNIV